MNLTHPTLTCQTSGGVGWPLSSSGCGSPPTTRSCSATTCRCCASCRRDLPARLRRPALQHRPDQRQAILETGRTTRRRAQVGFGGGATAAGSWPSPPTATRSTTTSASSRRASRRPAAADDVRHALLPRRLPRGALRQAAARRPLRPRVLPERDHLGLRLRRARDATLAGQARHDPRLRQGSAGLPLRRAEVDREPYMAPGLVTAEKARAASCRPTSGGTRSCLDRTREDRLPDAEAGGRSCAGSCWRPRGRATGASTSSPAAARSARSRRARPPLRPDRLEPGGGARDAKEAGASALRAGRTA